MDIKFETVIASLNYHFYSYTIRIVSGNSVNTLVVSMIDCYYFIDWPKHTYTIKISPKNNMYYII